MRLPRRRYLRLVAAPLLAMATLLTIAGLTAPTASAHANTQAGSRAGDPCAHDPTIASLQACVQHAAAAGFIDNKGVANGLLAKLNAAQAAADRDQPGVAVSAL